MRLHVLIRNRAAPDSTDLDLKSKQSSTAARGNFVNKTVLFVIMRDMSPTMYKENTCILSYAGSTLRKLQKTDDKEASLFIPRPHHKNTQVDRC
jgi:hypothetical protein